MEITRTNDGIRVEWDEKSSDRTIHMADTVVDIDKLNRVCRLEILFVRSCLAEAGIEADRFLSAVNRLPGASYDHDADSIIIRLIDSHSRDQPLVESIIDVSLNGEPVAITIPISTEIAEATLLSLD